MKKLLLIVGAGASKDVGCPDVNKLDEIIEAKLKNGKDFAIYPTNDCPEINNLYSYLKKNLNDFKNEKRILQLEDLIMQQRNNLYSDFERQERKTNLTIEDNDRVNLASLKLIMENERKLRELKKNNISNYEEIAYLCLELYSLMDIHNSFLLKSSIKIKEKLKNIIVKREWGKDGPVEANDFYRLYKEICRIIQIEFTNIKMEKENFELIKSFYEKLKENFEIGVITTNHDEVLLKVFPDFYTGFNEEGKFEKGKILDREEWNFLYHIHGSIHNEIYSNEIIWNKEVRPLSNSSGGSSREERDTGQRIIFQPLISGYNKVNQILNDPYETFFTKLNELVYKSDGVIFIGYGFGDIHINSCFQSYRKDKKNRKVLILDYENKERHSQFRVSEKAKKIDKCIQFLTGDHELKDEIFKTIENDEFYTAVFLEGFLKSCNYYEYIEKIFLE